MKKTISSKKAVIDRLMRDRKKVNADTKYQQLDENIEKFLLQFRREFRKGRLLTFKQWIKIVDELLDEI